MNNGTPGTTDLRDEFPDTPARRGVVAIVRAFGTVQRQMATHFAQFDLTPPQFQMLTVINRLKNEPVTQRRLARELYVSFPNITVMLARLEFAMFRLLKSLVLLILVIGVSSCRASQKWFLWSFHLPAKTSLLAETAF